MINKILQAKYGSYVTGQLLSANDEALIDNIDKSSEKGRVAVTQLLLRLKDLDSDKILPERFWNTEVQWGVDFSSWLGQFDNNKRYLFIGSEPHLKSNYQLVYDFGSPKHGDLKRAALNYYRNKNDIWHYIVNNFSNDLSDAGIESFLRKCYIMDLCHIVPKSCGQVEDICKTLNISKGDWTYFRTIVAHSFLKDEIKAVDPQVIILHGAPARDFFKNDLKVDFKESFKIGDWDRHILFGEYCGYNVITVPHLKGQMLNELWRSKKHPERPKAVKEIIQKLLARIQ